MRRPERGQTLVIVAIMLVGLLAMLALVIDIGTAYAQRRTMQNAADAGALAGARALALGVSPDVAFDSAAVEAAAKAAACQYAELNGAAPGNCAPEVIYGTRPEYANPVPMTVTVLVSERVPTFFASVIGIPHVDVSAFAASRWLPASGGTGFAPLTLRTTIWDPGETYQIYASDKEPLIPAAGDVITSMRGWLNIDGMADSANELKCWVCELSPASCNNTSMPSLTLSPEDGGTFGTYVEGTAGINNTVLGEMIDCGMIGKTIPIPVFDVTVDDKGDFYYHIVGFADFTITDIVKRTDEKYIQGHFEMGPYIPPDMYGDEKAQDRGLHTVKLVR